MTSQSLPMSAMPRESDPATSRATVTIDCSSMAALCRPDYKESADPALLSDGVPLPIEDDSITQPYPNEVYAQMMMNELHAEHEGVRPQRLIHLPTPRGAHRQVLEAVLMLTVVIVLPIVTIVSIQRSQTAPRPTLEHAPQLVMQEPSAPREPSLSGRPQHVMMPLPSLESAQPSHQEEDAVTAPKPARKPVRTSPAAPVRPSAKVIPPKSVPPAFEIEE